MITFRPSLYLGGEIFTCYFHDGLEIYSLSKTNSYFPEGLIPDGVIRVGGILYSVACKIQKMGLCKFSVISGGVYYKDINDMLLIYYQNNGPAVNLTKDNIIVQNYSDSDLNYLSYADANIIDIIS